MSPRSRYNMYTVKNIANRYNNQTCYFYCLTVKYSSINNTKISITSQSILFDKYTHIILLRNIEKYCSEHKKK